MNDLGFDFELESPLGIVHVETDAFSTDAYELYEMPSGMVWDLLSAEGPEQMRLMLDVFRLALVDPEDAADLDVLSFNAVGTVLWQWYTKSKVRIETGDTPRRLAVKPVVVEVAGSGEETDSDSEVSEVVRQILGALGLGSIGEVTDGPENDSDGESGAGSASE